MSSRRSINGRYPSLLLRAFPTDWAFVRTNAWVSVSLHNDPKTPTATSWPRDGEGLAAPFLSRWSSRR